MNHVIWDDNIMSLFVVAWDGTFGLGEWESVK